MSHGRSFLWREGRFRRWGRRPRVLELAVRLAGAGRLPVARGALDRGRVMAPPTYLPVCNRGCGREPNGIPRLFLAVAALGLAVLALGWSFLPEPRPPALRFSVRAETLDETGWFSSAALAVSPDGRHVAWGRHEGPTVRMVVDGKAGRAFDGLSLLPPRFAAAPGSGLYAYVAQRDGLEVVVWGRVGQGEVESRGYRHVPHFAFSADGEHLAWLVSRDWFEGVVPGDREAFAVVDGLEGPPYAKVGGLAISPHGDRVAYGALAELPALPAGSSAPAPWGAPPGRWGWVVVVDGREGPAYDEVRLSAFSPDGTRLAYRAQRDRRQFLVVDGVEGPPYRAIYYGSTVFSPDGRRLAYGAQRDDDAFLVLDGVAGPSRHRMDKFLVFAGPDFSPDSRRVAYAVQRHGMLLPVVDGVAGTPAAFWNLQFSPDSRRVVYTASRRAKHPLQPFVVLDGKAQERYAEVAVPVFSPDSRHLAYAARSEDGPWHVIVDGQEAADLGGSENVRPELVFSGPDALVAVYVRQAKLMRVVVDILAPP